MVFSNEDMEVDFEKQAPHPEHARFVLAESRTV